MKGQALKKINSYKQIEHQKHNAQSRKLTQEDFDKRPLNEEEVEEEEQEGQQDESDVISEQEETSSEEMDEFSSDQLCQSSNFSYSEEQEEKSTNSSKSHQNKKIKWSKGRWTEKENKRYAKFFKTNYEKIICGDRKQLTIFNIMSKFIKSRSPTQCRSHDQKLFPKALKDVEKYRAKKGLNILSPVLKKPQRSIEEILVNTSPYQDTSDMNDSSSVSPNKEFDQEEQQPQERFLNSFSQQIYNLNLGIPEIVDQYFNNLTSNSNIEYLLQNTNSMIQFIKNTTNSSQRQKETKMYEQNSDSEEIQDQQIQNNYQLPPYYPVQHSDLQTVAEQPSFAQNSLPFPQQYQQHQQQSTPRYEQMRRVYHQPQSQSRFNEQSATTQGSAMYFSDEQAVYQFNSEQGFYRQRNIPNYHQQNYPEEYLFSNFHDARSFPSSLRQPLQEARNNSNNDQPLFQRANLPQHLKEAFSQRRALESNGYVE